MKRVPRLVKRHPIASAAFGVALAVTLWLLFRLIGFLIWYADPDHRRVTPQPWMTPNYVARSWLVDPDDLAEALGLDDDDGTRPTLRAIALRRDVPVQTILDEVEAFLDGDLE